MSMISQFWKKKKTEHTEVIHLDYAAGTPVAPEVLSAMLPYFSEEWANPGAIYKSALRSREAIEAARLKLARVLCIRPYDVIFTGGGTESNNLSIIGLIDSLHKEGRAYSTMEIISTRMEHPSILEVLTILAAKGVQVRFVNVDADGIVDHNHFQTLLSPHTVLVTLAYVNSEVGVIQPIKRISRTIRAYMHEHAIKIFLHLDASQAPLWLPCALDMLGVDLMTLDAGKCYGPKGVGVLAMRHGITLVPQLHGGGQERGLRSTTENTPSIIGCVQALVRAQESWQQRSETVSKLRNEMIDLLTQAIPGVILNGSATNRVANNINVSILGIDTEFAVITLDAHGIAASTKSACGGEKGAGSHVVFAMTEDKARAHSTIRFTLGESTTKAELVQAVAVLKEHVEKMRAFEFGQAAASI